MVISSDRRTPARHPTRAAGRIGRPLLAIVSAIAPATALVAQQGGPPPLAERVVKVPATAMPWDTRINPKFEFGMHNGRGPVTVFDRNLRPGIKVRLAVTGRTTTVQNGDWIPAEGERDFPTGSQPEFGWPRFPSRYFGSGEKASYLNGIVGAFVDADGRIIGKPFPAGAAAERVMPEGAVALTLGLDDDNFADNTGELFVTVSLPQAKVTVE